MINSATPQLIELARAVRGDDWADELAPALVGAHTAGWDWPKTLLYAVRLMADSDASARDLTSAVRSPLKRPGGSDPEIYDRGGALARGLLAAREASDDPR